MSREARVIEAALKLDPATNPCILHTEHSPHVLQCEGHHVFPEYLQHRVWGKTRDQRKVPLCATGHTNVHLAIDDLDANTRWKHRYSNAERRLALLGWSRYQDALAGGEPGASS